jgi:hypothetical protein
LGYKRAECACAFQPSEEDAVTDVARKAVYLLVIGFAVFYLVSQPESAADAVRGALSAVGDAMNAIIRFFNALAE